MDSSSFIISVPFCCMCMRVHVFYPVGGTTNNLQFSYDDVHKNHVLTIKKPGLNIATDFTISLNYS